jgi:hypothetical protein
MAARNQAPASAEMIARRDEALEQIRLMLTDQRMSALDVATALAEPAPTVYGWLVYMRDLGEAHQVAAPGGRKLWVLGRDPVTSEIEGVDENAQRAWIVPARQVGMFRHWMDVAFFGPAKGAAA